MQKNEPEPEVKQTIDYSEGINSISLQLAQQQSIVREYQALLKSGNKEEYFIKSKGSLRTYLVESKHKVKSLKHSLELLIEAQSHQFPTQKD